MRAVCPTPQSPAKYSMRLATLGVCACLSALSIPLGATLSIHLVLVLLQFHGRECTDEEVAEHNRTGLLKLRNVASSFDRALLSALYASFSDEAQPFCGINTYPLDDYSRSQRGRCQIDMGEWCRKSPDLCRALHGINISGPDGQPVRRLRFRGMGTLVRIHAPPMPFALALWHSFEMIDLERLICPGLPWLCQGFNHCVPRAPQRARASPSRR